MLSDRKKNSTTDRQRQAGGRGERSGLVICDSFVYNKYAVPTDQTAPLNVQRASAILSGRAKKPYNLYLSRAVSLLGMDKAKRWALLSNPLDKTNLRNRLVYELAAGVSPHSG